MEFKIRVNGFESIISAKLERPKAASCLLVLGHGAGAGMKHAFMEQLSYNLVSEGVAVLRYQFPYMEEGRRRPDQVKKLIATVQSVLSHIQTLNLGLPVFLGGKSMGGRISSLFLSLCEEQEVRGVIFYGFPLHQPKKPDMSRAEHLSKVNVPMLFFQGTRDPLANIDLIKNMHRNLDKESKLYIIDTGDHSLKPSKKHRKNEAVVLSDIARESTAFMCGICRS